MFGGPIKHPGKRVAVPRTPANLQDNILTSVQPGHFQHYAREPRTGYKRDLLHHNQRMDEIRTRVMKQADDALRREMYLMKFNVHTDRRWLRNEIQSRAEKKMKEYEEQIYGRRERLKDLLAKDEREFCRQTVEYLQKGKELKQEEIRNKVEEIRKVKEEEKRKFVDEKRIQQYTQRSVELRPHLAKKHLVESKIGQLQQMRENESRRQSEKESDKMWEDVMNRENQMKIDREQEEAIDFYNKMLKQKEMLDNQVRGKELVKEEAERQNKLDAIQINKIAEQMKTEKLKAIMEEKRKRMQHDEELSSQIRHQKKIINDRACTEKALQKAYIYLSQLEDEKEKAIIASKIESHRRDAKQYRRSLGEIERHRKEEERKLDELLEAERKMIDQREDEAACKIQRAKEKLLEETMKGREEQLEYKKLEEERERKMKEDDNKLVLLTWGKNKELCDKSDRIQKEKVLQYREDLKKQIEYKAILKKKEDQESERQLKLGRQEEDKYRNNVLNIIANESTLFMKHPFRKVIEQLDCHCPTAKPK